MIMTTPPFPPSGHYATHRRLEACHHRLEVPLWILQQPQTDSYTEVLTRHFSHYAQRMSSGIIPTDQMFQVEARRLLFDFQKSVEPNTGYNMEWLANFRGEQSGDPLQAPKQASLNPAI